MFGNWKTQNMEDKVTVTGKKNKHWNVSYEKV